MVAHVAHYRILEPIASTSSEEYRARDTRTGRTVRIVLLPEPAGADPGRRRDLVRTAEAAAALSHPNIAALYECGEDGGRLFLAFEFVSGETLKSAMGGRPMNVRRALDLGAQVADGLAEAGAAGTTNPHLAADVVITPAGRAKIVNVGLTPWLQPAHTGTPAPGGDQLRTLGALLVEMLTGAPPSGAAPSSINAAVPREVDRIAAKALAGRSQDGYASPAALAADLRSAVAALDARRTARERTKI